MKHISEVLGDVFREPADVTPISRGRTIRRTKIAAFIVHELDVDTIRERIRPGAWLIVTVPTTSAAYEGGCNIVLAEVDPRHDAAQPFHQLLTPGTRAKLRGAVPVWVVFKDGVSLIPIPREEAA